MAARRRISKKQRPSLSEELRRDDDGASASGIGGASKPLWSRLLLEVPSALQVLEVPSALQVMGTSPAAPVAAAAVDAAEALFPPSNSALGGAPGAAAPAQAVPFPAPAERERQDREASGVVCIRI